MIYKVLILVSKPSNSIAHFGAFVFSEEHFHTVENA